MIRNRSAQNLMTPTNGGYLTALALYISRPRTHIPTKTMLAQLELRRER